MWETGYSANGQGTEHLAILHLAPPNARMKARRALRLQRDPRPAPSKTFPAVSAMRS